MYGWGGEEPPGLKEKYGASGITGELILKGLIEVDRSNLVNGIYYFQLIGKTKIGEDFIKTIKGVGYKFVV